MKILVTLLLLVCISACTSIDENNMKLAPGMSREQVIEIMGPPDRRAFRGKDEALQYQGVIGYGQCIYLTAWMHENVLVGTTDRRGASIAGCGLGSKKLHWDDMPKVN